MGLPRHKRGEAPRQWVEDMLTCDLIVRSQERTLEMRLLAAHLAALFGHSPPA